MTKSFEEEKFNPEIEYKELLERIENGDRKEENLFSLAFCYLQGYGTEQNLKKAEELLKLAAEDGGTNCQFFLSVLYHDGDALPVNEEGFLKYCKMAAENGHCKAAYNLACWYYEKEDYDRAEKWFITPASYGFADAQFNLGVLYFNRSCQNDKDPDLLDMSTACYWLSEAVNGECSEMSMAERAYADAKTNYRKLLNETEFGTTSDETALAALDLFFEDNNNESSEVSNRMKVLACILIENGYACGFDYMADLLEKGYITTEKNNHEIEMLRLMSKGIVYEDY